MRFRKTACLFLTSVVIITGCRTIKSPTQMGKDLVVSKVQKEATHRVNEKIDGQEESILNAIKDNDFGRLERLLKDVDDVKTLFDKNTLLLHLSEEGAGSNTEKNKVTELLISKKASLYQVDKNGQGFIKDIYFSDAFAGTPRGDYLYDLSDIISNKYQEIFKNDDVAELQNLRDNHYLNLHYANEKLYSMAARHGSQKIFAYLLNEKVEMKQDIMHSVLRNYNYDKPFTDTEKILKFLADNGADLKGDILVTLLNKVTGHLQMMEQIGSVENLAIYLVDKGANINGALDLAVDKNYPELTIKLIAKGEKIKPVFENNNLYVYNASIDIIKIAIDNGVDAKTFIQRLTVIENAQEQLDFLQFLLSKNVKVTEIDAASFRNNFENAKYFVAQGGKFTDPSNYIVTLLKKECSTDDFDYMFSQGANIDIENHNRSGHSFLHYTISDSPAEKKLAYIKYFVDKGVNVNVVNKASNETALDVASRRKFADISEYLESKGAKRAKDL